MDGRGRRHHRYAVQELGRLVDTHEKLAKARGKSDDARRAHRALADYYRRAADEHRQILAEAGEPDVQLALMEVGA